MFVIFSHVLYVFYPYYIFDFAVLATCTSNNLGDFDFFYLVNISNYFYIW